MPEEPEVETDSLQETIHEPPGGVLLRNTKEADQLLERHRRFANSVALIQVSIALAAVAALTRQRLMWMGSVTLGLAGASLFVITLVR